MRILIVGLVVLALAAPSLAHVGTAASGDEVAAYEQGPAGHHGHAEVGGRKASGHGPGAGCEEAGDAHHPMCAACACCAGCGAALTSATSAAPASGGWLGGRTPAGAGRLLGPEPFPPRPPLA